MERHCESLAKEPVKTYIPMALTYDKDERMKIWTLNRFKEQAIQPYAGWVALKGICTEYMEQLKLTQKALHEYLEENPMYKESQNSIITLAEEFLTDLKKAQKAIEGKTIQAQEEIKTLVGEN